MAGGSSSASRIQGKMRLLLVAHSLWELGCQQTGLTCLEGLSSHSACAAAGEGTGLDKWIQERIKRGALPWQHS